MTDDRQYFREELFPQLDITAGRSQANVTCPEEKCLLEFADESLTGGKRAEIRAHLLTCTECGNLVLEMQRVCAPIIRLHRLSLLQLALLHLRGAGRLQPTLEEAWTLHRSSCKVCADRAAQLERWGIRGLAEEATVRPVPRRNIGRVATTALAFGMGMLVMGVVTRVPSKSGIPITQPVSSVPTEEPPIERALPNTLVPDQSAEGMLKALMLYNPHKLDSQIEIWNSLPDILEMQKQTGLGSLYFSMTMDETDPVHREAHRKASIESLLKARREIDRKLKALGEPNNRRREAKP